MSADAAGPRLIWEQGTAYDLFMSLHVLHQPAEFGLSGTWAAGVRSRLPPSESEILRQAATLIVQPFHWLHTLPAPKDSETVLWALRQIPPAERLAALALTRTTPRELADAMRRALARGTWEQEDRLALQATVSRWQYEQPKPDLEAIFHWCVHPEEFGERYLRGLRAYCEAFFAEEEQRIAPYLQQGLEKAQGIAKRLPLPDLIEELSQGLRLTPLPQKSTWILAPSFWSTPFVIYGEIDVERMFFQFGARPAHASLVPGGAVPDALTNVLKALADPTRLRILHHLATESLTGAQLARRLRLRAPTVTHHLNVLRLAGLVYLTVVDEREQHYAIRAATIENTFLALNKFLQADEPQA